MIPIFEYELPQDAEFLGSIHSITENDDSVLEAIKAAEEAGAAVVYTTVHKALNDLDRPWQTERKYYAVYGQEELVVA